MASGRTDSIAVSAKTGEGLEALVRLIDERIGGEGAADPTAEASFRIPQKQGAALAALEAGAVIEKKRFEGNLVLLQVRGPASLLGRYRRFQVAG